MDYEKAYKASLKTAAQWIKDGCTDKEKICLECVFPELRESEDERIRKLLVWQVYRNIEDETNDLAQSVYDGIKGHDLDIEESIEDWKKCLAYLEKQKEQKHPNGCFTCDEYKKGYEAGRFHGFTAGYNKAMKEVEQKEQTPADDTAFEKWLDDWYQGSKEAGGDVVMSEAEFKNWSRGIKNMYQQQPKQE